MSDPLPTVFLVDDEPSVLRALDRLLRSAGLNVAAFASPQAFLDGHDPQARGCLVLDVAMPGLDGLALHRALGARDSPLPVIFLTGHGDIPMSVRALKQGAVDFLCKPVHDDDLLRAVHEAIEQDRLGRQARREEADIRRRLATLTPREREVLERVIAGRLNKQIAAELGTVEKTIKVHRAHVMEKMQVRSVAELVQLAARAGVTAPQR
ncbi:MAG: response regulator [Pseudomonadota bacterium]|nr:response regulator [Pseudomonadota bacterium]